MLAGVAVVFAAVAVVAASLGHPQLAAVPAILAAALAWIATRPMHPSIPVLYRWRVRSAWDDWIDALDRWNEREGERAFEETERATVGLADRLRSMTPPASERADHEHRVVTLDAYAAALADCHAAQRAGDEAALARAVERLHAARAELG